MHPRNASCSPSRAVTAPFLAHHGSALPTPAAAQPAGVRAEAPYGDEPRVGQVVHDVLCERVGVVMGHAGSQAQVHPLAGAAKGTPSRSSSAP